MSYLTQFGTATTSNTNLNTTTLVGTFTNTTRIRKLYINIFADQVKGNGDYKASITVQRAGAGSFYQSIITTNAAASGVTSILFNSIAITLNATDVMKVYLLGLSTDNDTTADVIVDVNEEWINIDANGRVDLGAILGTALTETAGLIAAAFKKFFNVATPTGTINSLPDAVAGATGGLPTLYDTNTINQSVVINGYGQNASGAVWLWKGTIPSTGTNQITMGSWGYGFYDGFLNGNILFTDNGWNAIITNSQIVNGGADATLTLSKVVPVGELGFKFILYPADNAYILADSRLPAALTADGNIKADALKINGAAPNNLSADQVWDEAIAGHLNAGSTGLALNTAGAAADPLTNPVPGTYAAGTAGAALGSITTGHITVTSPMSQDGLAVKLVRGDDYLNADGRALVWTDSGSNWPDLTGATVKFKWVTFSKTCTVIGAGGAHQQVSLDLTSAETDVLQNGYFDIEATLSNTHVVTLVIAGSLIIKDDV